jgi:hypothetical protein
MQHQKIWIFILLVVFISVQGVSQTGFNKVHDFGYTSNSFMDLVVRNDTIAGYGLGWDLVDSVWLRGVLIAQMDSSGNVIRHNFFTDSLGDHYGVDRYWGKLIATSDGGYAMTFAPLYRNSAIFMKVNSELELEFIKEYADTNYISNFYYLPFETENGYFLYGALQKPDLLVEGFIRLVDKQGEIIWHKNVSEGGATTIIQDIKPVNDSVFVCVSYTNTVSNTPNYKTALLYFDIDGNEINHWSSEINPEIGACFHIVKPSLDSIVLFGQHYAGTQFNTALYEATISQLDANFETVWVNHFGPAKSGTSYNTLHKFVITGSGKMIGSGEKTVKIGDEPTKKVGWMYKFSELGDSIWVRLIDPPFTPIGYPNSGYFMGMGTLSSGNIIAGGYAREDDLEFGWVVKLSPNGCLDTMFCQTSSQDLEVVFQSPDIEVWPNPVSGVLSVSYPKLTDPSTLKIVNSAGKLVVYQALPKNSDTVSFPTDELPSGVYYVSIHSPGNLFRPVKIVVR